MSRRKVVTVLAATAAVLVGTPAMSQELKIGLAAEPSSIDPHYHVFTPNIQLNEQIFETLVAFDDARNIKPVLAESWKTVNPKTWEFKLRKGVKFSDGTPFTAQDVVYSLCRIPNVPNSPSPFTLATRSIVGATAKDENTVLIETADIYPLLPNDLSKVAIISAKLNNGGNVKFNKDGCEASAWPATKDFNSGKLAIGTGPYKFGEFVPGSRIVLSRNDKYWEGKPAWSSVVLRPIPSAGPRVAALLSGDVDLIESPPSQDVPRLKADSRFDVRTARSARIVFMGLDSMNDVNTAVSGEAKNPFKDKRVRQAVNHAIDRAAIASKIMGGFAVPASQLMYGEADAKASSLYNPKLAKELLAQAGYPNGFELTLSGPNGRYTNDAQVAQAIAQMLTAVGIKTNVNVLTSNVYFPRQAKGEFGFRISGWSATTGEMSYPLRSLVATKNKEKGFGTANHNRYSNPALDALLEDALQTIDNAKRSDMLQKASDMAMDDVAVIPLHYEVSLWAMKKGVDYKGRWDERTNVSEITPSK